MKSTVVDESLSSFKPMYCSREYQASTRAFEYLMYILRQTNQKHKNTVVLTYAFVMNQNQDIFQIYSNMKTLVLSREYMGLLCEVETLVVVASWTATISLINLLCQTQNIKMIMLNIRNMQVPIISIEKA